MVLTWEGLSEEGFRSATREIHAENSLTNPRLEAFRRGDIEHIAEVKLSSPDGDGPALAEARAEFYSALRTSAELIKLSSLRALDAVVSHAREVRARFDGFFAEFGRGDFHLDPFRLSGLPERIASREAFNRHRDAIMSLRRLVKRFPAAARLGCFTLPDYEARAVGDNDELKKANAVALLASETASLLVARCIMLRFFEDHGFFGETKYLCNGGVAGFQEWRKSHSSTYAWFLRESYGEAARLAAALFEEGDLDWVLTCADPNSPPPSSARCSICHVSISRRSNRMFSAGSMASSSIEPSASSTASIIPRLKSPGSLCALCRFARATSCSIPPAASAPS